ncbi:hypothetical protein [Risungbinella massiliensis]|uniref:hypothetical protein n=1 Tax=Risungbinella massiliensis TaxID=1329796 RepID=UPI0005CB86B2|nr:hypothetical protein [Risungbinella massiliensis]
MMNELVMLLLVGVIISGKFLLEDVMKRKYFIGYKGKHSKMKKMLFVIFALLFFFMLLLSMIFTI